MPYKTPSTTRSHHHYDLQTPKLTVYSRPLHVSQVTLLATAKDTLPQPELSVHDGVESSDGRNDEDEMQVVGEVRIESTL